MSLGPYSDITCLSSGENEFSMLEMDSPKQEFSKAIFENLKELYANDTDLEVTIALNDLQPNPQQWVGLFKVGWKDLHSDAVVKKHADYDERHCRVRFEAASLPHDFGQYMYQLCYVSEDGMMVGASTPFDIVDSTLISMDDLVEHEEDDLLIIKERDVVAPQELVLVRQEHSRILQKNQILEKEQDAFVQENQQLNRRLSRATTEMETLNGSLREREQQVTHQQRCIDDLQTQMTTILTEREECGARCREIEQEKATMMGRIMQLERAVKERAEDVARLQETVGAKETSEEILRRELESLKKSLFSTMEEKETNTAQHLSHISSLSERISALERELVLAIGAIQARNVQIEAFQMTNEKMASDLETAVEQCDRLKRAVADKTRECVEMQDSVRALEDKLVVVDQRAGALEAELGQSRQSIEKLLLEKKSREAAAAAREIVIQSLQERTTRTSCNTTRLSDAAKATVEVTELKGRLEQAREEYRKKAALCQKLEMRLAKQADKDDSCDTPDSEIDPDNWKRLYEQELTKLNVLRQDYSQRVSKLQEELEKERAKFQEFLATQVKQRDMREEMAQQRAMNTMSTKVQADECPSSGDSTMSNQGSSEESPVGGNTAGDSDNDEHNTTSQDNIQCSVCFVPFDPNLTEKEKQEHIRAHFGPVCPVCQLRFKKHYPQEDFERHVYTHFNE